MPSIYSIPVQQTNDAQGMPQQFEVTLGGISYLMSLKYRNIDQGGWTLDISDTSGNAILNGIPLVTGCDLLAQYAYLGFKGALVVQTNSDPDAAPTFSNLGGDAQIYWVSP